MLLDQYKADNLFFSTNFCEQTSEAGVFGYRGDLVIVDGGISDKGQANTPKAILRGAVLLADDKVHLLIGGLDDIAYFPILLEKFSGDFADDLQAILFVVNAQAVAQFAFGNTLFTIIPLVQGVPWNETIEELAMEKSDFKGLSAVDKLLKVFKEMKSYKPKKATLKTMEELLADVTDDVREVWGAV